MHVTRYFSGVKNILCGILQGSTLGPLLFFAYINDLKSAFSKSIIQIFAEDTNLLFSNKNFESLNL